MRITESSYRSILSEAAMDAIHGLLFEDKATDTVKTYIRNNCTRVLEPYLQTNVNELPDNIKDTVKNVDTTLYNKCDEQNQNLMMFLRLHFLRYFDISHGKGPVKFIIGLARIGIGELGFYTTTNNQSELSLLKQLVLFADSNEEVKQSLDANLNGLSFQELKELLNSKRKEFNQQMRLKLGDNLKTGGDYKVIPINSSEEAEQYAKYFPDIKSERWCITTGSFDSYAVNGSRFYFCLEDGFENVQREVGPGCPLDEYGLSMVSVLIDMDGEPTRITTRWNHAHDGENNENLHTAEQVQEILGIPFYQTFKPYTREELHERGIVLFDEVQELLDNGAKPEDIFDYCGDFSEGFAVVELNDKCNFVSSEGKILSNQWFNYCGNFSEGFAVVELNDKGNLINREGQLLSNQWFDDCYDFCGGFAVVRLNGKSNFIDREGKYLSGQWFEGCGNFVEGFAIIKLNNKCNYVNRECKILSNQWFDWCRDFNEGFARVNVNGIWNFINTEGKLLSSQWFDNCCDFCGGFAQVKLNHKWNFINREGRIISSKWFEDCCDFNEGLARVQLNNKWFNIDGDGKLYGAYGIPVSESQKNKNTIYITEQTKQKHMSRLNEGGNVRVNEKRMRELVRECVAKTLMRTIDESRFYPNLNTEEVPINKDAEKMFVGDKNSDPKGVRMALDGVFNSMGWKLTEMYRSANDGSLTFYASKESDSASSLEEIRPEIEWEIKRKGFEFDMKPVGNLIAVTIKGATPKREIHESADSEQEYYDLFNANIMRAAMKCCREMGFDTWGEMPSGAAFCATINDWHDAETIHKALTRIVKPNHPSDLRVDAKSRIGGTYYAEIYLPSPSHCKFTF